MLKHTFCSIEKTPNSERFVNIQQVVKIDALKGGSVRLWLTNGEDVLVSGPDAVSIVDLLCPRGAWVTAIDERSASPVKNAELCYR